MIRRFGTLILLFLSMNALAQEWNGTVVTILKEDSSNGSDPTYFKRFDELSDRVKLRLNLGDEQTSDFQIGYDHYDGSGWYTNFALDGYGKGYFRGKLGIGVTNPFQKLTVIDGQIFIGHSNVNQTESGRLRFSEYTNSFQGAFIHYNGNLNILNIGVHNAYDTQVNNDINAISIRRNNGNVGIGTTTPDYKLDVLGTIRAKEVKVETGWSDFVFEPDYNLRTLDQVENYINEHGHLPDIPSAEEVEENGVNVGEMESKLLQKIEELTLYVIELKKVNDELKKEQAKNEAQSEEIEQLKMMVKVLVEDKMSEL